MAHHQPPPPPPPRPPPPPPPPPPPTSSGAAALAQAAPTALPLSLADALAADEELDVDVSLCGGVDWQRRCLELQLELHRLRVAAARARDNLRHRLAELEQRAQEAEARADEAEDRVRLMEQRLAAGDAGADSWVAEADTNGGGGGGDGDAQRTISQLETAVEEQRQLRLADARQVEAKAARIKAWVAGKLRDLEAQNAHLREQNARCAHQLTLLRQHLQRPPSSSAGGSGSRASLSLEGEWPPSEDDPLGVGRVRRPRSAASSLASDASSLPHESLYAHPTATTSDGLNDLCVEGNGTLGAEEAAVEELSRDLRAAVAQLQLCAPAPASSASAAGASLGPAPSPAPQRRLFAPIAGPQATTPAGRGGGSSAGGSGVYDDASHDYAEIYTPSRERMPWHAHVHNEGDSECCADAAAAAASAAEDDARPPTPPLHRFPSWETRIYQVAADGLLGGGGPTPAAAVAPASGDGVNAGPTDALGYRDIPPPVYATVKGRASQIRSVPFSGESSEEDSSDGEAGGGGGGGGGGAGPEAEGARARRGASSGAETDTSLSGGSGSSPSKSNRTASSLSPAKRSSSGSPSKSMRRDTSLESGMSDDYAIPPDALSCDTASASSGLVDASSGLALSHTAGAGSTIGGGLPALLLRASASLEASAVAGSPPSAPTRRTGEALEKAGHLAKLGGKLKTWRKRWFVLRDGQLSYWKSGADASAGRRPHATLLLDDGCRVSRADGAAAFEVASPQRALYLAADSPHAADEWVRSLQAAQRLHATRMLLSREDRRPAAQGWLTKVKNGRARRCWCMLIGRTFLYFKGPCDTHPVGQINMRECRVEEVEAASDSDSEEREPESGTGGGTGIGSNAPLTVAIHPPQQGPTYLLMPSKQDKDTWLYHLTVVSGGGGGSGGTQYEQLVNKLMEVDGDPNCVLWRHPQLLYTKESTTTPLTTLSSEALQAEAIKLFKSCQLFASVALDSAGIDYHVVLAQNALQQCLDMPELQSELVCALVRQTSRHTHQRIGMQVLRQRSGTSSLRQRSSNTIRYRPTSTASADSSSSVSVPLLRRRRKQPPVALESSGNSLTASAGRTLSGTGPTASGGGSGGGGGGSGGGGGLLDCKTNPPAFVFVQGWQLLALAVSLFVPKSSRLLWFLKLHLHRNADSKTECGKYAAYCQRALERTLQSGGREARPSRMEVLSLLLKNPFHHSLPHSIPVHLPSGAYHVVGFDGSSSVDEVLATLCAELGCRDAAASGLALASDDPIERDLEHFVDPQAKLCDVISKWETALREKGSGKFENSRCIQLTLRHRLQWRVGARTETDRERLLLCYETNAQALQGRFPLTRDLALEMAALMAQIDLGEYNSEKARGSSGGSGSGQHLQHHVLTAIDRFYPYRYRDGLTPEELQELQERLCSKWAALRGRSVLDCVRIYLTCARKWAFFGHGLFQAKLKAAPPPLAQRVEATGAGCQVWVAVGEEAVTLLDLCAMRPLARFPYGAVVTFGGCQDDFMLVVGSDHTAPNTNTNTAASHAHSLHSHSQHSHSLPTHSHAQAQAQMRLGEVLLPAPGHPPLKLLFALSRPKILELTLLIADYMNAMGHTLPGTPQMNTLTRHGSHRSLQRGHANANTSGMCGSLGTGVLGLGHQGACASPRSVGTLGTGGGGHTTASTLSSTTGATFLQVQHATTQTPPPSSQPPPASSSAAAVAAVAAAGQQQQQPDLLRSLAQADAHAQLMHGGGGGDSQPGSLHRTDSKKRSPHLEGGGGGGGMA